LVGCVFNKLLAGSFFAPHSSGGEKFVYFISAMILINLLSVTLYPSKATASHTKSQKSSRELKKVRLHQAHQLLGKTYKKSIVKVGEEITDIEDFVKTQLKARLAGRFEKLVGKIQRSILTESKLNSFDPLFLMAVIQTESSFNPLAKGPYGEVGLMQLRPETAKWISKKYGIKWRGTRSLKDPVVNIAIGSAYLDYLRSSFDFHSRLYIAAYNMGGANVHRALEKEIWPKDYPMRVMQNYIQSYTELSSSLHGPAYEAKRHLFIGGLIGHEE
jgi:soluble lytic murein transglycosylase